LGVVVDRPLHTGPKVVLVQVPAPDTMERVRTGLAVAPASTITIESRHEPSTSVAVPSLVNRCVVHLLRTLPPQVSQIF
jgi:hypothetical protein